MIGLVLLTIAIVMVLVGRSLYTSFIDINQLCNLSMARAKKIKKWRKQKARVIDISFNAHLVETSSETIEQLAITEGIKIHYEYMTQKGKTSSMSIIDFPSSSLYSRAVKIKKGDIIKVYVNPKNQSETYLFIANEDDYNTFKTRFFIESLPKLAFAHILFLSIIYILA